MIWRTTWLCLLLLPSLLCASQHDRNHPVFNSLETGCNPSNPDPAYLMCDDFHDGDWVGNPSEGGISSPHSDRWIENPWAREDTVRNPFRNANAGYGRCGPPGTGPMGTSCYATSGISTGTGENGGQWALHHFRDGRHVSELWLRFYFRKLGPTGGTDYTFGGEKFVFFQRESNGTRSQYVGLGFPWNNSSAKPITGNILTEPDFNLHWLYQNMGNAINIRGGPWYLIEIHINLGTAGQFNGTVEFWLDECGMDGRSCPTTTAQQTLRMRHTNRQIRRSHMGGDLGINQIWLERFNNPGATGQHHWARVVVATRRIGPMGAVNDPIPRTDPKYPAAPVEFRVVSPGD